MQQQLVALSLQLRLAEQLTEGDSARARGMLADLQTRTTDALEDLRDLARGIYPPLPADEGLAVALTAQARKAPVPTKVESAGIGRYPQEVEAAVYFSVLEALNNEAKYSEASGTAIALAHQGEVLVFSVTDDGRGFDPEVTSTGTGLQGINDRLEAIGGGLQVKSSPGEGTEIAERIPLT